MITNKMQMPSTSLAADKRRGPLQSRIKASNLVF